MQNITITELQLKVAQLAEKVERLRFEQAQTSAVSSRAAHLGKAVRLNQKRLDDYTNLLEHASRQRANEESVSE